MKPLVLVTGATGFVGSHMLDLLRESGYRLRVLVRRTSNLRWIPADGVEQVTADVRDPASLHALVAGVSWIFHFGGLTRAARREEFFRVNAEGTQKLWEAAREADGKVELFVFCSSLAAGGPARSHDRPRRESDTPQPISAYGQSKLVAERWLEENPGNGMRLLTVRPPAVYGPRDEMILSFFRWAKWGLLPLPGHGGRGLSLIHVRDLVQGCLGLAERGASGTFNLSDGRIYRWEDVGEATGRAIGRRLRPVRIPAAAVRLAGAVGELIGRVSGNMPAVNRQKVHDLLQPYWICDTRKARDHGFEPRIFLDEGIRETVAWYRAEGWL